MGPAESVGGFRLGAIRRAFGADNAERRMPSAWMISILLVTVKVADFSVMSGRIAV